MLLTAEEILVQDIHLQKVHPGQLQEDNLLLNQCRSEIRFDNQGRVLETQLQHPVEYLLLTLEVAHLQFQNQLHQDQGKEVADHLVQGIGFAAG